MVVDLEYMHFQTHERPGKGSDLKRGSNRLLWTHTPFSVMKILLRLLWTLQQNHTLIFQGYPGVLRTQFEYHYFRAWHSSYGKWRRGTPLSSQFKMGLVFLLQIILGQTSGFSREFSQCSARPVYRLPRLLWSGLAVGVYEKCSCTACPGKGGAAF